MTWQELYHKFDPKEPLQANDPRLCPELFGDFVDTVAEQLCLNQEKNFKLLFSGHIGCGKSTFFNLLSADQRIQNTFFVVKYSVKDVCNINDADHIDLLLSLTLQAFIKATEKKLEIAPEAIKKLQKFAMELQGLITEEEEKIKVRRAGVGAEAGLGILIPWLKDTFFARYQMEDETRKVIREKYKPKMTDFLNTINELLASIQKSLGDKYLLILVDDTDKIRPLKALEVFYDNGEYLSKPLSNILFSVNTSISCSSKYSIIKGKIGEEEFFPAIKIVEKDGKSSEDTERNKEMLKKLVHKRIAEAPDFIEERAMEEAINMSGGVVRELLRILQRAIFIARGKVKKDHVDYAVISIRNGYNLFSNHIRIMQALLKDPDWFQTTPEDTAQLEPTLLELLHMPAVFQYRDGDKWYRPYPIFIPMLERLQWKQKQY